MNETNPCKSLIKQYKFSIELIYPKQQILKAKDDENNKDVAVSYVRAKVKKFDILFLETSIKSEKEGKCVSERERCFTWPCRDG